MMAVRRAVAENRAGAALWIVASLLGVRMAIFVAGAVSEPSHGFVALGGVDRSGTHRVIPLEPGFDLYADPMGEYIAKIAGAEDGASDWPAHSVRTCH